MELKSCKQPFTPAADEPLDVLMTAGISMEAKEGGEEVHQWLHSEEKRN